MTRTLLIITFASFFMACNINPNKEARLQKLETKFKITIEKVTALEKNVQRLELMNGQLKTRIDSLEKH